MSRMDAVQLEKIFDELWPIPRSIMGEGFRDSLRILERHIPLERIKFTSGTAVFDWTVPMEWAVRDAYLVDPHGNRFCEFKKNNLHLLGYSSPFKGKLSLHELKSHLYTIPEQPEAIPYFTSYYKERWGFCLTHAEFLKLPEGTYEVVVDTDLKPGELVIGECVLPGKSSKEVLLSSYLCHPSLASNELSGPLVLAALYQRLAGKKNRRWTYRFVVSAETIGTIAYLTKRGEHLKSQCIAGYQMTCLGDRAPFTYKRSRDGNTLADRMALKVLENYKPHRVYDYDPADGSDERQYCSPGFNLPHGSLMRTMYAKYPEYHTSLDNKSFVNFDAMIEAVDCYEQVIDAIESAEIYQSASGFCEPQLGKRGLYPNLGGQKELQDQVKAIMWTLNLSDGLHELETIAKSSHLTLGQIREAAHKLSEAGLIRSL